MFKVLKRFLFLVRHILTIFIELYQVALNLVVANTANGIKLIMLTLMSSFQECDFPRG